MIERDHIVGAPCWCLPDRVCLDCGATEPCAHGPFRSVRVRHRYAESAAQRSIVDPPATPATPPRS